MTGVLGMILAGGEGSRLMPQHPEPSRLFLLAEAID